MCLPIAFRGGFGLFVLAAFIGCGNAEPVKAPPTNKVEGVVVRPNGKPALRGAIEFRHVAKPEFPSMGEVDADGRFSLRTIAGNNQNVVGAQEGEHTVTYTPTSEKQEEMIPVTLSKKYMVKAGDNNITVTLEK